MSSVHRFSRVFLLTEANFKTRFSLEAIITYVFMNITANFLCLITLIPLFVYDLFNANKPKKLQINSKIRESLKWQSSSPFLCVASAMGTHQSDFGDYVA